MIDIFDNKKQAIIRSDINGYLFTEWFSFAQCKKCHRISYHNFRGMVKDNDGKIVEREKFTCQCGNTKFGKPQYVEVIIKTYAGKYPTSFQELLDYGYYAGHKNKGGLR
jgi:hypothetical protein